MRTMHGYFLNLGPPSKVSPAEANADIEAMLHDPDADFVVGCEAVRKGALPKPPTDWEKFRDRSTPARSNIYAYFNGKTGKIGAHHWNDMDVKFHREPGRPGMHPPRSFLVVNFCTIQFVLAHHPPNWPGTDDARREHLNELAGTLAPWTLDDRWERRTDRGKELAREKQRFLLWDRNMRLDAHRRFAERVDGEAHGVRIDSGISRHLRNVEITYGRRVGAKNQHTVHTDHPWGAAHITFEYAA